MTDIRHPLVMVVDDDLDTRDLYRMVLESVGYRVEEAGEVAAASEALARATPDLVLTDWLLPDGDGLAVCRAVHASRRSRHVPVIAVTGVSLDQAEDAAVRREGITEVLRKPANPDDILGAIRVALTKATERRLCDAAMRARRYAAHARRRSDANAAGGPTAGCEAGIDAGVLLQRAASRSDGSIALVIADDSGRYVAASGATRQLTGYDAAELTGLSVWDLTPLPDTADGQGLWQQFIAAGAHHGHYVLRRRDGRPVDAQYCAVANIAPGWHVSAIAELPDLPSSLGLI
jgi:PAS domain S-box-containing protein